MLSVNGLSPDVSSNDRERILIAHVDAGLLLRSGVVKKHMLPRLVLHLFSDLGGWPEIEYGVVYRRSLSRRLGSLGRRSTLAGLLDPLAIYATTGRWLLVPDVPIRPCGLYHLILLPLISAWLQLMIGCRDLLLMGPALIEWGRLPHIRAVPHRPLSVCGFLHHWKMQLMMRRDLFRYYGILLAHIFLRGLVIFL